MMVSQMLHWVELAPIKCIEFFILHYIWLKHFVSSISCLTFVSESFAQPLPIMADVIPSNVSKSRLRSALTRQQLHKRSQERLIDNKQENQWND